MKIVDKAQAAKGRVFCYARWSSVGQTLGSSEVRQLEAAQSFSEGRGLSLSDDVYEDKGVSAWRGKHRKTGALGALLDRVQPGDAIVINSYSRWSREHPLDGLEALRQTTDKGVTVHFTAAGMSVSQANFKQLFGMLSLHAQMANGENDERSYNIRKAMATKQQNLKAGKATFGRLPAWLAWNYPARPRRDDRKVVVLADKAALVKMVFKLCIEGKGVIAIEREMRQHPPIANSRKADWNGRFIHRLINDRAVLGFHADSEKLVYPDIVDADTFHAAGAALAKRRTWTVRESVENNNLFTKLAYCQECGSPLVKQTTRINGQTYSYLMCGGKIRHKTDCHARPVRYDAFEASFLTMLSESSLMEKALAGERSVSPIDALRGELVSVNKSQNKLMAMIDGMDAPPRQLADKLAALNAREDELNAKVEAEEVRLKTEVPSKLAYEQVWAELVKANKGATLERAKLRVALHSLVERVTVKGSVYKVALKGAKEAITVDINDGNYSFSPAPAYAAGAAVPAGQNVIA